MSDTASTKSFSDTVKEKEEKISKFSELLDSLENTEDKKKLLWKEVYENALNDRENAGILLTDLLMQTQGNTSHHLTYGSILTKYLERMSKSNDQILRLAEIIAKEEDREVDINDIYSKINDG
tara:strand:+ start:1318 stop:1686 length:369 start_codon:yes stop_codon:yes gene_type:complete